MLKIRIFNLAENEFQTTKLLDFSLTLEFCRKFPDFLGKCSDFERSRSNSLTFPGFPGFQVSGNPARVNM